MSVVSIPQAGGTFGFIVSEANGYRSREQGVMSSGAGKVPPGMICGKITATGEFVPLAPAASDGSQTFAGISCEAVDATSVDVQVTFIVRDAEVQRAALAFAGSPTTPQKNAAYASMAAAGIALR